MSSDPANTQSEKTTDSLKERFRAGGMNGFSAIEALTLALALGGAGEEASRAAALLIEAFGGLRGVFDASPDEITAVSGISGSAALFIKLLKEAAGEHLKRRMMRKKAGDGQSEVSDYLELALSGERVEKFLAVFLDGAGRAVAVETLFEGTINQTAVYPRKAVEMAFKHGAVSIIFAHNHPSGDCTPSESDRLLTLALTAAARAADLEVVDHVIIGRRSSFSARRGGWLGKA